MEFLNARAERETETETERQRERETERDRESYHWFSVVERHQRSDLFSCNADASQITSQLGACFASFVEVSLLPVIPPFIGRVHLTVARP